MAALTHNTAAPQDMSMQRGTEHQAAAKAVSDAKQAEQQQDEEYDEDCCLASCCVAVCCRGACGADHDVSCYDWLSNPLVCCERWCYWCGLCMVR